ncbi:phage tail tape measure protein [Effusibacillus pohliae]|uniref:phage tail tape measure protein n=1 Tax=Effusibacillus pohliae TaxID=232270 RepID=UPI0003826314|nr:phage tail tape measure protein [Effusibacillus pohliae]
MAEREARLNLVISAQNQAASVFSSLSEVMKSFRQTAESAARAISSSFEAISKSSKSMDDVSKVVSDDERSLQSLSKVSDESAKGIEASFRSMETAISAVVLAVRNQTAEIGRAFESMAKNAETNVGNVKKSVDSLGGLVSLQLLGQSMQHVGESGEHLFKYAIEQGADFEAAMKSIQTVIATNIEKNESWNDKIRDAAGLTQQLQDLALSLGSRGAHSANEIAAAMDAMLRSGVDGEAILNGAAEAAQNVAIVTHDKLEESANLITEIYHQFREQFNENGKSVQENMKETGNVIAGTLLSARINSNDLITTLKYVGPVASQLGSSLADAAAASALLAQNGIKGSSAGTALRRALTNLLEPTKQGAKAMEELGIIQNGHNTLIDQSTGNLKNLTEIQKILHSRLEGLTEAQKAKYIHDIFGQYALAGTLVLANENSEAFQRLKEKIEGVSAQKAAAAMLDTFKGHMSQLAAHVQTAAKEFGMSFIPVLEKLIPIGHSMLNWLQSLTEEQKKWLMGTLAVGSGLVFLGGAFAGLAAWLRFAKEGFEAFGKLFLNIGRGLLSLGVVFTRFVSIMVTGLRALAIALLENPITAVIVAAVAVVAWGAYEIYKHWDTIKAAFIEAGEKIVEGWNDTKQKLSETWTSIKVYAETSWNAIKAFFTQTIPKLIVDVGNWCSRSRYLAVNFSPPLS